MAAVSFLLTLMSLYTFFLVLPMLVLPPLAFFLGLMSYKADKVKNPTLTGLPKLVSLFPMAASVAAFLYEFYIMNTRYRP